ncbi:MAG: hypothetical protein QXI18_01020 [Nitrososphaerota archaeon]
MGRRSRVDGAGASGEAWRASMTGSREADPPSKGHGRRDPRG